MKQYGQIIAQLRKQHNLTQAELGKKLSVSYQAVSKWENNQSQPDLDTIQLLANVFGITVAEFLDYDQPQTKTVTTPRQNHPSKNKIWYLVSGLAVAIFVMILIVALVPIKLSSDKIYRRVDPAVFCITLEKENGDQMAGTGFFINDKGLAVTNYHVIENCIKGEIKLNNGETYAVTKIVGCDEKRDIAIIQVDIKHNKKVTLGNSNRVKVGETVYAIGYPQSFVLGNDNSTLTQGIISKTSYTYEENNYIQTTVNITHGNSGGVLLNEQGKVIGITTSMLTDGSIDYMNLAIPVNALKDVKHNLNYTLEEYKEQHVKFYYYASATAVYQEIDVMKGDTVKKINPPQASTGYKFGGWYKDKTFKEEFDFSLPIDETAYCYAKWNPISYTVRFLANGYAGTMEDQIFYYGQWQALSPNRFSKKGYQFVNWTRNFTNGLDPVTYRNQQNVFNLTSKDGEVIELTANLEIITATIKFDANKGTGKMSAQTAKYGEQIKLNKNVFTRMGYQFVGWSYDGQTFPDEAIADDVINAESDITLTAVWEPITYYVVYLKDDASTGQDEVRVAVKYDESFTFSDDVFENLGHHITYWTDINTQKQYSVIDERLNLTTEAGKTFYLTPTWEANHYTVALIYNRSYPSRIKYCTWDEPFALELRSSDIPRGYQIIGYELKDGTALAPNAEGLYVNLTTEHDVSIAVYPTYKANRYSVYLQQALYSYDVELFGTFDYE